MYTSLNVLWIQGLVWLNLEQANVDATHLRVLECDLEKNPQL